MRTESREKKVDKLQAIVEKVNLSEISSIKHSVTAIIRVINNPGSTVKELKEIIQLDPPLAARILRTANSFYYSRSFNRGFTEIEQAIIWLGTETIKELALSQKVCEIFSKEAEIETYSRKTLWKHSIAVALMAKLIYRKEFGLKGENAYAAGLLHDIGLIIEDQFLPEDFKTVLQWSRIKNIEIAKAEQTILGYDHAEIGGAISISWTLPEELSQSIGFHTNPLLADVEFSRIVSSLYVADYFCHENDFPYGDIPMQDKNLFRECLKIIEVKPYALDLILENVKQEIAQMEDKGLFG